MSAHDDDSWFVDVLLFLLVLLGVLAHRYRNKDEE